MTDSAAEYKHPSVLPAVTLHGLGVAAAGSVLLFRRAETATRLDLLGALEGELILLTLAHVISGLLVASYRRRLPAGKTLLAGAVLTSVGVALMAWTIELGLFAIGGTLFAVGSAPAVVVHRPLLSSLTEPASLYRTLAWYWAGIAAGLGLPLGLRVVVDISEANLLWICFGLIIAATALLLPHHSVSDDRDLTESAVYVEGGFWTRRSSITAAGAGAALVAGAGPAADLLVTAWQRSPRQTAAVLGVAALAGVIAGSMGSWYHQLDRLRGSSQADAIGIQLIVSGAMMAMGALSFTYIGLIVCWAIAGAAMALAVIGLDAAVLAAVEPNRRRRISARQLFAFVLASAGGLALLVALPESASEQWRLAMLAAPLVVGGAYMRRFAESSQTVTDSKTEPVKAQLPERVLGIEAESPLLAVEQLNVGYGHVQVLFNVDLEVRAGQVVALLGTNGAGKTTLLRALSGLEPTLGGRVVYAGLDITSTRPTWRVGMGLHQIVGGESVVGPLTVDENLRLFAHGIDAGEHDPVDAAYDTFPQISDRRNQQAMTLSGGERQMLALSKALMVKPQLLLIDEFSLGLAPVVIAQLLPVVREIAGRGTAILLVEQSVNIALSLADYAYVIEKGQIGFHGKAEELRAQPDLMRSVYMEGLSVALGG